MNRFRIAFVLAVLVLTALMRIAPHPLNFTPAGALALFAGAHILNRRLAYLVPLSALLLRDLMVGFHIMMPAGLCLHGGDGGHRGDPQAPPKKDAARCWGGTRSVYLIFHRNEFRLVGAGRRVPAGLHRSHHLFCSWNPVLPQYSGKQRALLGDPLRRDGTCGKEISDLAGGTSSE